MANPASIHQSETAQSHVSAALVLFGEHYAPGDRAVGPAASGCGAARTERTAGRDVVVAGSAAIGNTAINTTIIQSSQRAVVNWQSFNIGSQQTVDFRQPSSSALVLVRVIGPNLSQIAGKIDANGQVVLVNQSGVTFYPPVTPTAPRSTPPASSSAPRASPTGTSWPGRWCLTSLVIRTPRW